MAGEKAVRKDEYGRYPHNFPHRRTRKDRQNHAQSQAGYQRGRCIGIDLM